MPNARHVRRVRIVGRARIVQTHARVGEHHLILERFTKFTDRNFYPPQSLILGLA